MAEAIASIGTVITGAAGWMTSLAGQLITNEIFLLGLGLTVFGIIVGKVKGLTPGRKRRSR